MGLFDKFWTPKLQRRIVRETNRYVSEVLDVIDGEKEGVGLDSTWGGRVLCFPFHMPIDGIEEIAMNKTVLGMDEPLFHCLVISQTMIQDWYEQITRCLHVANAAE